MKSEFIIQDISIKYANANNPLQEGLFYRSNTPEVPSEPSASTEVSGSVETEQKTSSIAPYSGSVDAWTRRFDLITKFPDSNSAIEVAKRLNTELPVRVLLLNIEGNQINVNQIKFP